MTERELQSLLDKYDPEWRDADLLADYGKLVTYLVLREQGNDHKLAAMFACRKAPASRTDRDLFAGRHTLAQQFAGNEKQLTAVVNAARRQGYNPGGNDLYDPCLAQTTGDPRAFIPATGGRGYVRRICEAQGLTCHGNVEVAGRQPEAPIEAGALGANIVEELIEQKLQSNPDLARVDRRELAAEIQHQHGYSDTKRSGQSTVVDRNHKSPPVKAAISSKSLKKRKP